MLQFSSIVFFSGALAFYIHTIHFNAHCEKWILHLPKVDALTSAMAPFQLTFSRIFHNLFLIYNLHALSPFWLSILSTFEHTQFSFVVVGYFKKIYPLFI
jgi:hypothetical protein